MKLFLTGGTGFLGRNIYEKWDGSSYLYSRNQYIGTLSVHAPDYIIHCAAEIKKNEEMFDSNIALTYQILEEARKLPIKAMVYIGSSSEYGRKSHPMTEKDFLDPTTLYEATKGAGSLLCQAYAREYGVPVMIARPFSLYGKYEPDERLIPTAIRCAKAGWELNVSPGCHDFIHVDDFIEGLFLMLKKPMPGEIYNFGTGIQRSNNEVVDVIEKAVGRKVKRVPIEKMRVYDTDMWVCDYGKANRTFLWQPRILFEEVIRELC